MSILKNEIEIQKLEKENSELRKEVIYCRMELIRFYEKKSILEIFTTPLKRVGCWNN